jgi:aminoglycoside 2'-N-acetyltransferase I
MRIQSAPEAEVPAELRAQVAALRRQAWPGDGSPSVGTKAHDPLLAPLSMLLLDGERVVAALEILSKELSHRGQRYAASGLSTVVTDRALRRRGYGRALVEAARERVEGSGADLGIFTCDTPLEPFYASAGWQLLPGTVLVGGTPQAPFPSDRFDKVTMGAFFSAHARAHAGEFLGARIELYPGEIDRLW